MRAQLVVVAEAAAAFRRGLGAALEEAGYQVMPGPVRKGTLVIASLRREEDCALVDGYVDRGVPVVALVSPLDSAAAAHALGHGAAGVADWEAAPEVIVAVVDRARDGEVMLPAAVARTLAGPGSHAPRPRLDDDEADWLHALARGMTVVALADDYGYSERAMFRRLHELYVRLGAANRSEAMVAAQRLGLLDGD